MNSNNASVRPKIRAKHSEVLLLLSFNCLLFIFNSNFLFNFVKKLIGEPLEKRSIRFEDRDGIQRYYPAMVCIHLFISKTHFNDN
jgi:hypothetical protein